MKHRKLGSSSILSTSFGSTLTSGQGKPRDFFPQEKSSNRWIILMCLLLIFLFAGFGRIIDLQIISGGYYKSLSDGNRIRRIPIKSPRGEIVDRNGKSLARNIPIYKLASFTKSGVVESTQTISREQAIAIQATDSEEANRLLIEVSREYPLKEATAHLVGYVNETTSDEITGMSNVKCQMSNAESLQFQLGDLIGRAGVEEQYDCVLRGVNGEELIEVDARGKLVRRLGRREPIPGKNIQLTIDSLLQNIAYTALIDAPNEKGTSMFRESGGIVRGGLVVENPQNGEILALVSVPSFDPSSLSENYSKLVTDKHLPFFNRAISGTYHPGSTFKIVTATAGLESKKIDENYKFEDVGFLKLGESVFRNWYYIRTGRGEGVIDLTRAIARSTDTFFYKVGELVGVNSLVEWSTAYNLGRTTGIDIPGEASGLLPTPEWKEKVIGERWYLGNTYNFSIGQGDLTATPLQISAMMSTIAAGGKWCKPHILLNPNDKIQMSNCREMGLKESTLQLIKAGLVGACSVGGTAGQFFNYQPQIACKTGTAEVGNNNTHAWFTSYGPESDPQISVTAVIEQGGEGSTVAAPVVKKVYKEYFKN